MSQTQACIEQLVGIAKEIRFFAKDNNRAFLTEEILTSWAEEIIDIAENEIGYD